MLVAGVKTAIDFEFYRKVYLNPIVFYVADPLYPHTSMVYCNRAVP